MKAFLEVLKELLTSKKFITAVAGLVVLGLAKIGFQADTDTIIGIITVVSTLLLGQGLTDHGKAKEEMSNIPKLEIIKNALTKEPTKTEDKTV